MTCRNLPCNHLADHHEHKCTAPGCGETVQSVAAFAAQPAKLRPAGGTDAQVRDITLDAYLISELYGIANPLEAERANFVGFRDSIQEAVHADVRFDDDGRILDTRLIGPCTRRKGACDICDNM
jgi:hypothetical protein